MPRKSFILNLVFFALGAFLAVVGYKVNFELNAPDKDLYAAEVLIQMEAMYVLSKPPEKMYSKDMRLKHVKLLDSSSLPLTDIYTFAMVSDKDPDLNVRQLATNVLDKKLSSLMTGSYNILSRNLDHETNASLLSQKKKLIEKIQKFRESK